MHPADGVLDRHGDVLFGHVGRGARAAVAAVEVDDVPARVVHAARNHVHLVFYIIRDDCVGRGVIEALERAAARGVSCRVVEGGTLKSRKGVNLP